MAFTGDIIGPYGYGPTDPNQNPWHAKLSYIVNSVSGLVANVTLTLSIYHGKYGASYNDYGDQSYYTFMGDNNKNYHTWRFETQQYYEIASKTLDVDLDSSGNATLKAYWHSGNVNSWTPENLEVEGTVQLAYVITLNSGSGYFDIGGSNIENMILTKNKGEAIIIPITDNYKPICNTETTEFYITGKTYLDEDISQTAYKHQNFEFSSWNTESDGSGRSYNPGSIYDTNNSITLYAIYTDNYTYSNNTISGSKWDIERGSNVDAVYITSFNGNGGTCNVSSLSAKKITSYTLGGWYSEEYGMGTEYNDSSAFTSAVTIYANWNSETKTESITLPEKDDVTRKGYEFINWNTVASGTGVSYDPGSNYTPSKSTTLYAIYEAKGLVRIETSSGRREALALVFNGTEWVQTIPNVFDKTQWKISG